MSDGRYVSKPLIDENGNISVITIDRSDEAWCQWRSSYPWPDHRIAEVIDNAIALSLQLQRNP